MIFMVNTFRWAPDFSRRLPANSILFTLSFVLRRWPHGKRSRGAFLAQLVPLVDGFAEALPARPRSSAADIERDPLLSVRERDPDALGLPGKVEGERAEAHLALLLASRLVGLGALVGRPRGAKDAEDVGPLDDAPPNLEILRGRVAAAVVGGGVFPEKVVRLDLRCGRKGADEGGAQRPTHTQRHRSLSPIRLTPIKVFACRGAPTHRGGAFW